jgi:membrane fusion protein (multidrug efflux system)
VPQKRLCIPEVALMADQAGRFIYIVGPDNTVRRQNVAVDGRLGNLTAIESGLNPDDLVVINGLQKARPGGQVKPTEVDLGAVKEKEPKK